MDFKKGTIAMELKAIGKMEALPEKETQTSSRQGRCGLVITDEYAGGLMGLEAHEYIQVLFGAARPLEYAIKALSDCGEMKGRSFCSGALRYGKPSLNAIFDGNKNENDQTKIDSFVHYL